MSWELSDPFAFVGLLHERMLKIKRENFNIFGGTLSIGHPSAVTGLRLVQNLMLSMKEQDKKYGIAATPGLMGIGMAVLLERTIKI